MNNTNITLEKHLETFVNTQIQNGRYNSINEVICAGLRILEKHEAKTEALRNALIEGENSGRAEYSLDKLNNELDH